MKQFATLIAIALTLTVANAAQAQDLRVGLGASIAYPVSLDTGDGIPPTTSYTLKLLQPMNGWALVSSVGFNTTFGPFQPRPQLTIGPSWRVGESRWSVGGGTLYRYLPKYDRDTDDHFLSVSAVAVRSFDDFSLSFLTGPGYLVNADAWSWAIGFGFNVWLD